MPCLLRSWFLLAACWLYLRSARRGQNCMDSSKWSLLITRYQPYNLFLPTRGETKMYCWLLAGRSVGDSRVCSLSDTGWSAHAMAAVRAGLHTRAAILPYWPHSGVALSLGATALTPSSDALAPFLFSNLCHQIEKPSSCTFRANQSHLPACSGQNGSSV